jgi:predicted Zn-dependent peptidase
MLSAGQSSLLRRKLILEREITDRLHTSISSYHEGGMFLTSFAIQPSVIKETRALLAQSLCDLRENPNKSRQDFERAQSHAIGSLSVGIDRRMMRRALDGAWETLRRGKCSWDELISSLESLKFEQFTEIMTEITREGRMTLVLAGDV